MKVVKFLSSSMFINDNLVGVMYIRLNFVVIWLLIDRVLDFMK